MFAIFIVVMGFLSLVNSSRIKVNPPSSFQSLPSNNLSPSSRTDEKQATAWQDWDALPVLLPISVEMLPDSGETKPPKPLGSSENSFWRGPVEFSPDGKKLAYIDKQNVLRVLNVSDRQITRALALDKTRAAVNAMFSLDNQTIAVMQREKPIPANQNPKPNRVGVWSLLTGKQLGAFKISSQEDYVWPQAVLSESEILLRTTSRQDGKTHFFLWNPKTGKRSKSPISFPDTADWRHGQGNRIRN